MIGVDSLPLSGSNYPFVAAVGSLLDVIEDLHISTVAKPRIGLWLRWVAGLGSATADSGVPTPVNVADLLIGDDTNAFVIDTRGFSLRLDQWAGSRWVLTWTGPDTVVTATVQMQDALKAGYLATNALLDPRTVDWRPEALRDVLVHTGSQYVSVLRSDGRVRFREGYNTNIVTASRISNRGENSQDIELNFQAGSGLGLAPGCGLFAGIRSLGGAVPDDNGDLLVTGDRCLSVQPVIEFVGEGALLVPGEITIRDACAAGCTCADFTDLYQYVTRTWSRYRSIASRASDIRDAYHGIVAFMRAARECAERKYLRAFVWPVRPCTVAAAIGICNPTDEPLYDVELEATLTDATDVAIGNASCDSIFRVDHHRGQLLPTPYYFEEGFPNARVILRCVPPGSMGYVVFQAALSSAEDDLAVKLTVSCTAGPGGGLPAADPASYTANLTCQEPTECEASTTAPPE